MPPHGALESALFHMWYRRPLKFSLRENMGLALPHTAQTEQQASPTVKFCEVPWFAAFLCVWHGEEKKKKSHQPSSRVVT